MALLHQVLSPYSVLLELQEHCWANGNGCYPFLTRPRPSRHPSALIDYLMFTWSLTVSLAPWEVGVSNLGLAPELSVEHRTHLLWTQEYIQPSSGFNLCTRSSGDSASSWTRWSDLAEVLSNNVAEMQSVGSYFNFHQLDVLTPLVAKQWMENIRLISSARSPRGQTQNGSQTKRIWSKDEYLMDNNQRNIENRFYCSRHLWVKSRQRRLLLPYDSFFIAMEFKTRQRQAKERATFCRVHGLRAQWTEAKGLC